jgi:hypothetical protein
LFFTAGAVSLSLELIAFYLFQATAGSLYTHLALLIGVFMLGLAIGAWLGTRTIGVGIGWLSQATLLAAILVLGLTWRQADFGLALVYHLLFLLVVALATGTLFVAATRHYYAGFDSRSRGTGYAVELAGSACGALLTNAVLLPLLGLYPTLVALGLVLGWRPSSGGADGARCGDDPAPDRAGDVTVAKVVLSSYRCAEVCLWSDNSKMQEDM